MIKSITDFSSGMLIVLQFAMGIKFYFLILVIALVSCSPPDHSVYEKDWELAKKSLLLIQENRKSEYMALEHEDVLKKTKSGELDLFFEQAQAIINNSIYPSDSMIVAERIKSSQSQYLSLFGGRHTDFYFPFTNRNDHDSTLHFKLTLINGKIYGARFIHFPSTGLFFPADARVR